MIHVLGSNNIDYSCGVESLPGNTIIHMYPFTTPGDKGANQAVATQRATSSLMMTSAVMTDKTSAQALACLANDGVGVYWMSRTESPTRAHLCSSTRRAESGLSV